MYQMLKKLCKNSSFTDHELMLISQSREAFLCVEEASKELRRQARVLNEEVVSDSDSDSTCAHEHSQPLSDSAKKLIRKKRAAIRRNANRLRIKKKKEANFLSRKVCICTHGSIVLIK